MATSKPQASKMAPVSYVVRKARRDDCDELYQLILDLCEHVEIPDPTMTKEVILEDGFGERPYLDFFVGEYQPLSTDGGNGSQEKKIVAFASMSRFNHRISHGRSAYLSGLYIDEAHRGKGLGVALMAAVSKVCVDLGLVQIDFDVLQTNLSATTFYPRLGATNNTENNKWEFWQLANAEMKKLISNIELKCPSGVSITM